MSGDRLRRHKTSFNLYKASQIRALVVYISLTTETIVYLSNKAAWNFTTRDVDAGP